VFGAALLVSLYLDLNQLIWVLIGLTVFEALTNQRIPRVVSQLRYGNNGDPMEGSLGIVFRNRTSFEAERGWRLLVATMLTISVFVYPEVLWFFPWFMGFAILGAGISGVCPMFLALKWLGLK
jgi:hypothetical protein